MGLLGFFFFCGLDWLFLCFWVSRVLSLVFLYTFGVVSICIPPICLGRLRFL